MNITKPDSAASTTIAEPPKGFPFFLCGAAVAGLATFFFSNDWCCASMSAGFCGGIAALVAKSLLNRIGRRLSGRGLAILFLGIGLVAVFAFRINTKQAFEHAFGMPPPAGIRFIEAERHYAGGPGDSETMIIFHADRATLESIMKKRSFKPDEKTARNQQLRSLEIFGRFKERATKLTNGTGEPEVYRAPIGQVERVTVGYFPNTGLVMVRLTKS